MSSLFALDTLVDRLRVYVARRELKPQAFEILEQVLQRGELPRGEAGRVSGLGERTARDLLATLVRDGIVGSDTPKGAVSLRFRWMPSRSSFRICSPRPETAVRVPSCGASPEKSAVLLYRTRGGRGSL